MVDVAFTGSDGDTRKLEGCLRGDNTEFELNTAAGTKVFIQATSMRCSVWVRKGTVEVQQFRLCLAAGVVTGKQKWGGVHQSRSFGIPPGFGFELACHDGTLEINCY